MRRCSSPAVLSSFLLLAACAPPSVEEVSAKTGEHLSSLVGEAWDSVAQSTDGSAPLTQLITALNVTQVDLGLEPYPMPTVQPRASSQPAIDAWEKLLKEKVFTQANVESSGPGGLVFLIHGRDFCDGASSASCADAIDKLQLRVIANGDPEATLQLDLAIGKQKLTPISLTLEKDRAIELTFRLGVYRQLLDSFSTATLPLAKQFEGLDGEYRMRVEKLGAFHFAFSFNVTQDVKVGYRGEDGQLRSWQMSAHAPMYRLEFDGKSHAQSAKVDFGAITWSGPVSDVTGEKDTRLFSGELKGLEFDAASGTNGTIATGHFAVLGARATLDGADVFNLARGQNVDLTLGTATDGRLKLTATDFDAAARFHFSLLPGWKGSGWLGDDQVELKLTGPNAAVKLSSMQLPGQTAPTVAYKLLNGNFSLTALNAHDALVVAANSCVAQNPKPTGTGPLASFTTGSCQ